MRPSAFLPALPPAPRALAITLASALAACGGPREVSRPVKVMVETTPPGAMVTVRDGSGARALGRGPVEHEVEYVESVYESTPAAWITTGVFAVATAVGVGLFAAGVGADRQLGNDGTFTFTDDTGLTAGGLTLAVTGGTTLLVVLPLAIIGSALDGDVMWSTLRHGPPTYEADLAGYRGAAAILDSSGPAPWRVQLALTADDRAPQVLGALAGDAVGVGGLGLAGGVVGGSVGGGAAASPLPFVAVFDVDDRTGALDAGAIATLTDQLTTKLTEHRAFRVVPAADLRARLVEAKKESYRACVDERCQIELGKAVAADRTLSVRIMKVGAICTVNGVVYDLTTEATERAASVRGACGVEALLDAIDTLAGKLSSG